MPRINSVETIGAGVRSVYTSECPRNCAGRVPVVLGMSISFYTGAHALHPSLLRPDDSQVSDLGMNVSNQTPLFAIWNEHNLKRKTCKHAKSSLQVLQVNR